MEQSHIHSKWTNSTWNDSYIRTQNPLSQNTYIKFQNSVKSFHQLFPFVFENFLSKRWRFWWVKFWKERALLLSHKWVTTYLQSVKSLVGSADSFKFRTMTVMMMNDSITTCNRFIDQIVSSVQRDQSSHFNISKPGSTPNAKLSELSEHSNLQHSTS